MINTSLNKKRYLRIAKALLLLIGIVLSSYLSSINLCAQDKSVLDSLAIELKQAQYDTTRIQILLEIGDQYEYSNPDKAIDYFYQAYQLAEQNVEKGEVYQELVVYSIRHIGLIYYNTNAYDKALEYFMKSLRLSEEYNYLPGKGFSYNNIGLIHDALNNYNQAIEYYKLSLDIALQMEDVFGVARAYNNLGVTHARNQDIRLAIESYQKSAEAFKEFGNRRFLAATYNNIGTYYLTLAYESQNSDSVLLYNQSALSYFQEVVPIFEKLEEPYDLTTAIANLARAHLNIHNVLPASARQKGDHLNKSIELAERSLMLAKETKSFSNIYYAAYALMEANEQKGDLSEALDYAKLVISNNDSLFSTEKDRTIAEMEAIYQTEKKQQEIERQRVEASRQKIIRNAFFVGLILMFLLAVLFYNGYANKKKTNSIISEQYSILEQANAEILTQRDELEAQRDMVVSQNEKLEEMYSHITNSLQYAQSIQAAILPSEKILEQIGPNYFVLMKPCELVSGDFFWATVFDEYRIFCVADCTGHGVPGAFMSILGITALNDIVVRHRITKASEILGYLRQSVIEALSQNDPEHLHRDGMDIALCVFNMKTRELQFAGAGLPIWLLADSHTAKSLSVSASKAYKYNNQVLLEIKGTNMPIGQSPVIKPFKNHSFNIQEKAVTVYLATDGYADQFGGDEAKKFQKPNLINLVLTNQNLSLKELKDVLNSAFEEWKDGYKQLDDVTVLGVEL